MPVAGKPIAVRNSRRRGPVSSRGFASQSCERMPASPGARAPPFVNVGRCAIVARDASVEFVFSLRIPGSQKCNAYRNCRRC